MKSTQQMLLDLRIRTKFPSCPTKEKKNSFIGDPFCSGKDSYLDCLLLCRVAALDFSKDRRIFEIHSDIEICGENLTLVEWYFCWITLFSAAIWLAVL